MEDHNMILSDETVSKECKTPELVDLNSAEVAQALPPMCANGSSPGASRCGAGTHQWNWIVLSHQGNFFKLRIQIAILAKCIFAT